MLGSECKQWDMTANTGPKTRKVGIITAGENIGSYRLIDFLSFSPSHFHTSLSFDEMFFYIYLIFTYLTGTECPIFRHMQYVRRKRLPLLWSTVSVRETALAKGFCSVMGNTKYPCVCRRAKLPGRGVHREKVREIGRR